MKRFVFLVTLTLTALAQISVGIDYSIYDLQYQANPEDPNSPHIDEDVNSIGGIVIHKFPGTKPKVTLYDPAYPDGWGGIAIKDFTTLKDFYNTVNIGDWVSLTHTTVEESNGNTQLMFESKSSFVVESTDNDLPAPIVIEPNDITAPVYQAGPEEGWLVSNHNAEKYEAMLVRVENVIVTEKDLGKAVDNYSLEIYDNPDPNDICWAADYMNNEVEEDDYHRFVDIGNRFCSVTGIIEQYKKYDQYAEMHWDYYQLLTTSTDSFVKADLDEDCDFDLADFSVFALYWWQDGCTEPNWCGGADLNENGNVNMEDLAELCNYWLWGNE